MNETTGKGAEPMSQHVQEFCVDRKSEESNNDRIEFKVGKDTYLSVPEPFGLRRHLMLDVPGGYESLGLFESEREVKKFVYEHEDKRRT